MVQSLKKSYISAQDAKKLYEDILESLPPKKWGQPLLLSKSIDKQLQVYLENS